MKLLSLLVLFLSVSEGSIPHQGLHYHSKVALSDDFYGDCKGLVVAKELEDTYVVEATCSLSGSEVLTFRRAKKDLTIL